MHPVHDKAYSMLNLVPIYYHLKAHSQISLLILTELKQIN